MPGTLGGVKVTVSGTLGGVKITMLGTLGVKVIVPGTLRGVKVIVPATLGGVKETVSVTLGGVKVTVLGTLGEGVGLTMRMEECFWISEQTLTPPPLHKHTHTQTGKQVTWTGDGVRMGVFEHQVSHTHTGSQCVRESGESNEKKAVRIKRERGGLTLTCQQESGWGHD